jgi:hypothetical protein
MTAEWLVTSHGASVSDVGFWPNADVETRLSTRPLSGAKRS